MHETPTKPVGLEPASISMLVIQYNTATNLSTDGSKGTSYGL